MLDSLRMQYDGEHEASNFTNVTHSFTSEEELPYWMAFNGCYRGVEDKTAKFKKFIAGRQRANTMRV